MKTKNIISLFTFAACLLSFTACSSSDYEEEFGGTQVENKTHTIPMVFNGAVIGFDQKDAKSPALLKGATSSSWKDGDKVYITFYNGTTKVPGEAIYSSSTGWSVSYDGNLAAGTNLKSEVRYFVNATFQNASLVTLNPNSEIYEDVNATYTYNNGSLTVMASLVPKTGRIRFTGTSGARIHLTGITTYTTFAPDINSFSTSEAMIHQTVATDGSTPYVYGYVSTSERNISLVGDDFAFNRTFTSDMLKTGESGYMAIPSEPSHNNWRTGLYVKVEGVEMKMVPVNGHSSGFFLIGETELTEGMYNAVMGDSQGATATSLYPKTSLSYNSVKSFIEKLNYRTHLNFDLPTSSQWMYAAKGGNLTRNYNYSGSDNVGDVAWYKGNASSKQPVKLKTPNELGIYDMSGNVSEYIFSTSLNYTYYFGGNYTSSSDGCTPASNIYLNTTNSEPYIGFRLILTCE